MTLAIADRVHVRAGLVVSPEPSAVPPGFEQVVGGHPVPTESSEQAGRRALALADEVGPDDTLLVLVSGGASALMAVPADGVTLEDKRATTDRLLRAGADIHALNTVRKHLSAIKGGRLATHVRGTLRALVISDVVGDDLSVIASGPTVADASTFADALAVLRRFGGEDAFPPAVVDRIRRGAAGEITETPKPGEVRLARAETTLIGSRRNAMSGAVAEAQARGYHVVRLNEPIVGEARTAALEFLRSGARAAGSARPTCIVSSGETTVQVTGTGKGGRNQEFVLAAVEPLARAETPVAMASVGTDGIDGPTDAAGALADDRTLHRAEAAGLKPGAFLSDNNAYAFFDALGDLIHTGPTGTNVGDLQVILVA
jgi:hydroxypyruvate reductase